MTYTIFKGYDHFNDYNLFRVYGLNNDYVGEWHTNETEAIQEMNDLIEE